MRNVYVDYITVSIDFLFGRLINDNNSLFYFERNRKLEMNLPTCESEIIGKHHWQIPMSRFFKNFWRGKESFDQALSKAKKFQDFILLLEKEGRLAWKPEQDEDEFGFDISWKILFDLLEKNGIDTKAAKNALESSITSIFWKCRFEKHAVEEIFHGYSDIKIIGL